MKVLIIQPSVPEFRREFFEHLLLNDVIDCSVICSDEALVHIDASKNIDGLTNTQSQKFWGFSFLVNLNYSEISKYDVIVTYSNMRLLTNYYLLFFCYLKKIKLVGWGHYKGRNRIFGSSIRHIFLRLFNAQLFYTRYEAESFVNDYKHAKVGFLNNGLPKCSGLNNYLECKENFVSQCKKRRIEVLTIGRLTGKCKLDKLINVIENFEYNEFEVNLHVIGANKQEFASFYGVSEDSDNIIFHGGISDFDKIKEIAANCSLFVYFGDIGLSLIHAYALGLPVIVHDQYDKHMPEIDAFNAAENGFTFSRDSENALDQTLRCLIDQPELTRKVGLNNWFKFHTEFNCVEMSVKFIKFIEEIV